jgi:transposase
MKSLVRKTLGVKDHKVVSVEKEKSKVVIVLERKLRRKLPCSKCGGRSPVYDRLPARRWRHVPLWGLNAELCYAPSRVHCPRCGVKVEKIPWCQGKSSLTTPLVILLAERSKLLALEVVAKMFGVSWPTVGSAVKQAVAYGLAHRRLGKLGSLGIDEISRRKGHTYHTQIYDLERKRLLESMEDRKAESLEKFLDPLGAARLKGIAAVCCDMWEPYAEVVRRRLPQAILVFDKFHLFRHLLDAVNQVRKEEAAQLKSSHPELLKGAKYLFLKNPWNLTPKQKSRLGALVKLNLKVNRAYVLKELFRDFYRYRVKGWAARYLNKWFWWATHSRLKPMRDFAWLLRDHERHILAWHDCRINNGAVEALNNVAKAISHRSHGFKSAAWFRTVLLLCMGDLPMPKFTHKFS